MHILNWWRSLNTGNKIGLAALLVAILTFALTFLNSQTSSQKFEKLQIPNNFSNFNTHIDANNISADNSITNTVNNNNPINDSSTNINNFFFNGSNGEDRKEKERYLKKLGVTEAALNNFFRILEQQDIESNELDHELRKIARRHKELEKRAKLIDSDDPKVKALQMKAISAIDDAKYDEAMIVLKSAVALDNQSAEKLRENYKKRKLSAANNQMLLAETFIARSLLHDAFKAYEEAIKFANEAEDPHSVKLFHNRLGGILVYSQLPNEALDLLKPLEENIKRSKHSSHSLLIENWYNQAHSLFSLQQYKEAEKNLQKALAHSRNGQLNNHSVTAAILNFLGLIRFQLKDYPNSILYFKQAEEILNSFSDQKIYLAVVRRHMIFSLEAQDNYEEALCYYDLVLPQYVRTYGENHENTEILRRYHIFAKNQVNTKLSQEENKKKLRCYE